MMLSLNWVCQLRVARCQVVQRRSQLVCESRIVPICERRVIEVFVGDADEVPELVGRNDVVRVAALVFLLDGLDLHAHRCGGFVVSPRPLQFAANVLRIGG